MKPSFCHTIHGSSDVVLLKIWRRYKRVEVYVVVDMEGISGIVNQQQVSLGEPDFQEGRRLLAGDVNAAVAGAFEAGATRVVVSDFHDSQRNFPIEQMDPRAEYEVPYGGRMPALNSEFAALIVIGMHARSGTPHAFLEHTVDPAWHRYSVDGVEHGEFDLLAFAAAALGVPCVFVSGDQATIDEARRLVPNLEGVVVKEGLARGWCRSLAPDVAHERIRDGVVRALRRRGEIALPALRLPATVRIEFNRCSGADEYVGRLGIRRVDGFSIEWTAAEVDDLVRF
jgi:D-amino peptidase